MRLGYTTLLEANTPTEAIHLADQLVGEIHLLFTDVIMPEMHGRDLAVRLLGKYPEMKCLFMSGYTAEVIPHRSVLDEGVYFIQKPFSQQELATMIRSTLNGTNT